VNAGHLLDGHLGEDGSNHYFVAARQRQAQRFKRDSLIRSHRLDVEQLLPFSPLAAKR
jgi:hypothetical protein